MSLLSVVLEVSANAGPYLAPAARDKLDLQVAKQKNVNLWQATVAATACHRASGHAEHRLRLRLVRVAHAAAPSFSPGAARSSIARGLIRVRRIERVRLHADLTILARLATALVKARTGPPAG